MKPHRRLTSLKWWAVLTVLWMASVSSAHELPANRLTLVMRDTQHVTLTYHLDYLAYVRALHQALAPQRPAAEFVLMLAAMPAPEFQKEQARAHAKFSKGTQLNLQNGQALVLTNWQWPNAARAHALMQQRAMQAVVGGGGGAGDHAHEAANGASPGNTSFEIRAEATSTRRIDAVNARLPDEFGNVLVVSYQPKQAWVKRGGAAAAIKF
jgi:hypothetical protein